MCFREMSGCHKPVTKIKLNKIKNKFKNQANQIVVTSVAIQQVSGNSLYRKLRIAAQKIDF